MRTSRITLVAVAGVTLAAGSAAPALAHEGAEHEGAQTVEAAQQSLATSTAREETLLGLAIAQTNALTQLTASEKAAIVAQLTNALNAVKSAAAGGVAATTIDGVDAADDAADSATFGALRTAFGEYRTIASAARDLARGTALRTKLASLVAQYAATSTPVSPNVGQAAAFLDTAAADAAAARGAALADPATARADEKVARTDLTKAGALIAAAAQALAAAIHDGTVGPTKLAPVSVTKPIKAAATSTKLCDGAHSSRVGDRSFAPDGGGDRHHRRR
jgi:hypothetical protein